MPTHDTLLLHRQEIEHKAWYRIWMSMLALYALNSFVKSKYVFEYHICYDLPIPVVMRTQCKQAHSTSQILWLLTKGAIYSTIVPQQRSGPGAIRKLFLRALLANSFWRAMTPLTRNGYHNKPVPISPCLIISVKNSNTLSCVRNKKTRRETFQCFDLVPLILEIWRYIS